MPFYKPRVPMGEVRLRLPRPGEILATVVEQLGGSRMIAQCADGKERLCRIPGRVRKKLWIKNGDWILITPWSIEPDTKCDLEYRYTNVQVEQLKLKGIIKV